MSLHSQIETYVLDRIQSGELGPGDAVETERELEEKFGVSRPTVRQALNKLTTMGYLVRVKGRGTFVSTPKTLHRSSSVIESYRQEVGNKQLVTRVDGLELVRAEPLVAQALGLRAHAPVVRLARTRWLEGGKPVVYTVVFVPQKRFPDMTEVDFTQTSFYDALDLRGLRVTHASRTIEVIPPPPLVAQQLEIGPFEPVIYVETHSETENGQAIEYAQSYYPGSTSKFLVEIHR